MAIRPPREDLYRELGVGRAATSDELAAAFRARAKELHPDARPRDVVAAERFKRVSHAYAVLRDPLRRARYDAGIVVGPPAPVSAVTRPSISRTVTPIPGHTVLSWLGPRGARRALWGGTTLLVLGLVATIWVVQLQRHDADLLAAGIPARATVVESGGDRRLEFTTRAGRTVRAAEAVKSGTEQPGLGAVVRIRYDRTDPSRIVVDSSHTARNVTLWIVAVKFLVGGAVLAILGARRLRGQKTGAA